MNPVRPDGPVPARIMIVGEAPGENEVREGKPFVGPSGWELTKMLKEAGIDRNECFFTNLARYRPPDNDMSLWMRESLKIGKLTKEDERKIAAGFDPRKFVQFRDQLVHTNITEGYEILKREIAEVKPNVIIPVGNSSMWALTGNWGILNWRGSMLYASDFPERKVIPTIHPASVLREWSNRPIVVHDFRRAKRFYNGEPYPDPGWQFHVRPSYEVAFSILSWLYNRLEDEEHIVLSFDLETSNSHIACAGVAWTKQDSICLPFTCTENPSGYWSEEQESEIVFLLCKILTHRNSEIVGQNLLYDAQYCWRYWHFVPRVKHDTMIAQHSIFSNLPKRLGFICSLHCDFYQFWKEDK